MSSRKKITELREDRKRTYHYRDVYGDLVKDVEEIEVNRPVRTIAGGKKFANYFIDGFAYYLFITLIDIPLVMMYQNYYLALELSVQLTLLNLLAYPLYYFIFETLLQRSPAKYLTRCRVINIYCEKPDWRNIALRSLIRLVPFEPFSCLADDGRGWHDSWSDTWVVGEEEYEELRKLLGMQTADATILE